VEKTDSHFDGVRFGDFESAGQLPAGSKHYRAYVGPPDRFDFMSATQFALLFALGLRDHHRVLDFGCGSLRLGRLLIPFLRPQRYFGVDPNRWLIEDAIDRELGRSILRVKYPRFAYNDDFKCDVFNTDEKFDFVVAQSVITHCGNDLAEKLIQEIATVLAPTGKFLFSIIEDPVKAASPGANGWVYPNCVAFGADRIDEMCVSAGLMCRRLPWFHPGAVWYIAAGSETCLPSDQDLLLLRGAVLFDPQFDRSVRRPREEPNGIV
jgi:SAM-dependent methyltransferase